MKLFKKLFFVALCTLAMNAAQAQFTMDAEIRPRSESRLGSKNVLSDSETETTNITSQRTRLNLNYKADKYTAKISFQDVRNWGSGKTLNSVDSTFNVHEAWANIELIEDFSMKVGRQEIVYDDHRIFGSVGWAQQARSHDLGILKYNGLFEADLGYSFHNEAGNVEYQEMHYLWLRKKYKDISISALALDTDGLLTAGTHLKGNYKDFKVSVNYYLQKESEDDITLTDASLLGLDLRYALSDFTFGLGYEQQSGNSQLDADNGENNAFSPLFGTNHKFNGHMDYFYVNNHGGSVGLNDMYFSAAYKLKALIFKADYHMFSAAADLSDDMDAKLGDELDFSISYKHSDEITMKFGYSFMTPTESFVHLKGSGDVDESNNWTWLMFVIKPKFM